MKSRRFHDRAEAGRLLADRLRHYAGRDDVIVLALTNVSTPASSSSSSPRSSSLSGSSIARLDDCLDALSGAHNQVTRRSSGQMTLHVPPGRLPSPGRSVPHRRHSPSSPEELAAFLGATY